MKLSHIFQEILSEDFKSQTKRYIAQGIEPEIVKSYVDKFKHIRDKKYKEMFSTDLESPVAPNRRNDIDAYTDFHDLEQLVDYVAGQRPVSGAMTPQSGGEQIDVSGKAVYKDENFEVYYADSPRACITYKGKFPYSWCVARSDSSNMFYTYRFKPYEPAFYFVKNLKLTEKEFGIWNMAKNVFKGQFKYPYHFFVIQVPKNAKPDDNTTQQYIVSSANNDGDKQMSWEEILKISPKLNSIREVLEPKPFTPEERKKNERFKNGIDDEEFKRLSYEDKRSYLDIYPTIARPITTGQLMHLPDDLLNLYVSFGIGLNDEQFNFIKPKKDILKRYAQISKRKLEEYLKDDNYNRNQLKMAYTELVVLDDADIKTYLDSLSDKDIAKFINTYGEDKFEMLEKHLPHKFSQEHISLKNLITSANAGDDDSLARLQSMVPEGIEVRFHAEKIIFGTSNFGNSFLMKQLDSSTKEFFDSIESRGYYGYDNNYFDGDDEGLENTYDSELEKYISNNPDVADRFKSYGLSFDLETLKDLLETYNKKEEIENEISTEFSYAGERAEEREHKEIRTEVHKIIYIEDETDMAIGVGPFIMYLTKYGLSPDEEISADGIVNNKKTGERFNASARYMPFFSTNTERFIENIKDLAENILSDYDVPDNYDSVWEAVNEARYNFSNTDLDQASIDSEIERAVDDCIEKFSGEDEYEPTDDKENVAKLKSQVIGSLNNILKGLGQDPFAKVIENNIVKIEIDRSRFQLEGKVYVKITNKEDNKSHEGYIFIKDLPKYFTNYKLFEQLNRIKSLIKY